MKKMNKILAIILAILMIISIIPITASAATPTSGKCGDNLTWSYNETSYTLTISGTGDMYDYATTGHAAPWNSYDEDVCTVILDDRITSIGDWAFYNSDNVTEVDIPDGVTRIGNHAFGACNSLERIIIPDSVTEIDDTAFWYCDALVSVTLPNGNTTIGKRAFDDCTSLTEVYIPEGITHIGEAAFPFSENFKAITVDEDNPYYSNDEYGVLFNKDKTALIQYPAGRPETNYVIPEGVTTINSAFYSCGKLESITIPESVTTIDDYAFDDFTISITYSGTVAQWKALMENNPVMAKELANYTVHCSDETIRPSGKCGENLTWVFDNATGTLTISGSGYMYNWYYDVVFAEGDRPWEIFTHNYIKNVVIEEGVLSIGTESFCYCDNLETVSISSSVIEIDEYAFIDCEKLSIVYYAGTQEKWYNIDIYAWNDELTDAKLYTSDYVVYSDYGKGVPLIEDDTITWIFDANSYTLTVSGEGDTFNDYMFDEWFSTKTYYQFTGYRGWDYYKYDTKKIVIDNGINYIGNNSFRFFLNATDVVIPLSVTEIGKQAFKTCNSITDVYYAGTEEQWKKIVVGTDNEALLNANIHYNYVECEHNYETTVVTEPTCINRGYTTHICSICKDSYVDNFVVKPHEYDAVVTAPTCTKQGYTTYTCSVCGYSEKDDYTSSTGHDYQVSGTFNPTCTSNGYIKYTCANGCGSSKNEKTESSLGHDYGTTIEIIEPTCTAKGYTKQTCARCRNVNKYDYVAALGHNYVATSTIAPNCIEKGYTIYTCSSCGEIQKDDYIDATGHSYEWKISVEPTCRDSGNKTGICSVCGDETTETVSRLGHDWGEYQIDIAPTCTEDGQESRHCSRCDWRNSPKVIPAAHTYGEWKQVTEGACREYARFERICTACGSISLMDAPIEHKYESVATAPTCTDKGYTTYTCTACGDSYVDDFVDINANNHSYISEITTPATHLVDGVKTFTCSDCGDTYTETIEKIAEHNYDTVVTAPTCTERGYTTYTCECGDSYVDDYVDALGHTPSTAFEENYVAPTCTENGSKDVVVYCSVCDEKISIETVIINAIGHADNDGDGYCDDDNELLDPSVECDHNCHKDGISGFFWRIINFFNKLFGLNKECSCGVAHY